MYRLQRQYNSTVGLTLVFFKRYNSPFCCGKNKSSDNPVREEWPISFSLGGNDKNLGESFAWGLSKNEQTQFFDSQMYLPVILTP